MIHLPILSQVEIKGYRLYPANSKDFEFSFVFPRGVSLVVGTNGLGKTTLINILYRCLVGPFNPPKDDGAVVSARQRETVWRDRRTYFSKRVGDQAVDATARLQFEIGSKRFDVTRRLSDVRLVALTIDGTSLTVPTGNVSPEKDDAEKAFKLAFQEAIGASSFVAALQVVRHLVFFDESRRALLWDTQSQAAMLRDLLIGSSAAGRLRDVESRYMSADSRERNLRWQVNALNTSLGSMRAATESAGPVASELAAISSQLKADQERHPLLAQTADDAEQNVRRLRLQVERARLNREDIRRIVEEQRLIKAGRLFRNLPDTGKYILSRFYSGSDCLACGADVAEKLDHIDDLVMRGHCPVCDSPPEKQEHGGESQSSTVVELSDDELEYQKTALGVISRELSGQEAALAAAEQFLKETTKTLSQLSSEIDAARKRAKALSAALPPDDETIRQREREREAMVMALNRASTERREGAEELRSLLAEVKDAAQTKQATIVEAFQRYAGNFLAEDARLTFAPRQAKLGQTEKFELPRFQLDMSSAAYGERVPRYDANDVSESQREFIDLAYRMALIDSCVSGPACLIMETPEASLDGVFMEQAGRMLNAYGSRSDRQMLVTSNLSNAGMIKALMEGHRPSEGENVINLFNEAAPTEAVNRFRDLYEGYVDAALGDQPDAA